MKGWICAFFIILTCAQPNPSQAYFKYVPPHPPAKRYHIVRRTFSATASYYVTPKRNEFETEKEFRAACKLNGDGKRTFFGKKPHEGLVAANLREFKKGTIIHITNKKLGLDVIEIVGDRCKKAEDLSRRGITHFDMFSRKLSHKKAYAWGMQPVTVETTFLVADN